STGIITTHSTTTPGITLQAGRFITAAITTAAEWRTVEFTTVPAQPPGLSMGTSRRLEDTLNLTARAAFAPALTATTTMADRQGVSRRAEAPAWVAEQAMAVEGLMAAVAGVTDRGCGSRVSWVRGA